MIIGVKLYVHSFLAQLYSRWTEDDSFEWGDLVFERDLKSFNIRTRQEDVDEIRNIYGFDVQVKPVGNNENMEFHDTLFDKKGSKTTSKGDEKSILVLGCGNSRMGVDILHYYLDLNACNKSVDVPKVIQCDISTHAINSMNKRYLSYVEKNQMSLIQDDATQLTLFEDESIDTVVDKGLIDGLFCAEQPEMITQIMNSVNLKLKAGKVFMFFSLSKPKYLLQHMKHDGSNVLEHDNPPRHNWESVNVWEVNQKVFMYHFVKKEKLIAKKLHLVKKKRRA